ncbi:unnamed protein product [Protopolystoma xenopodis]|uniref:Uncharacterized protein n=1 Tax=Protopolystoma xenopodis TaxID=117903 RepID=A0A448XJ66_9PLAT|nr:unnamed protein product [Protopolystoma xenopodis]
MTQTWTEQRNGEGTANFLTGAGGFLQSLVHGYAGLRLMLATPPSIQLEGNEYSHFSRTSSQHRTSITSLLRLNPKSIPPAWFSTYHEGMEPNLCCQSGEQVPSYQDDALTNVSANVSSDRVTPASSPILHLRGLHFRGRRLHVRLDSGRQQLTIHLVYGDDLWAVWGEETSLENNPTASRRLRINDEQPLLLPYQPVTIFA